MQRYFLGLLFFLSTTDLSAQVTTSGIKGTVFAAGKNILANASIKAVLESTGEKYNTTTQSKGNFTITNMKSGGPYTITISYPGYAADTLQEIFMKPKLS